MTNALRLVVRSRTSTETTVLSFFSPGRVTTYSPTRPPSSQSRPTEPRYAVRRASACARGESSAGVVSWSSAVTGSPRWGRRRGSGPRRSATRWCRGRALAWPDGRPRGVGPWSRPIRTAPRGPRPPIPVPGDEAERLRVAGHEHEVGGAVPLREDRTRDRLHEADDVVDAEEARQLLELVGPGESAAARSAEDGDRQATASSRVALQQLTGDPEQHVGGLERLDPTDEEEQLALDGQTE